MTGILEQSPAATAVRSWLSDFDAALTAGDAQAAAQLFTADSF